MAALELVASIAQNQGERLTPRRADEILQEVARRAISPLTVLYNEHKGLDSRNGYEKRHQLLEQA